MYLVYNQCVKLYNLLFLFMIITGVFLKLLLRNCWQEQLNFFKIKIVLFNNSRLEFESSSIVVLAF